jgi:glycerol-3-phosphate acyltransferase PlsX
MSYLLMKDSLRGLKGKFDASEYGGAPLLGLQKPVIKAHGSSDARAIANAVRQAETFVNTGIIAEITSSLGDYTQK